MNIDAQVHEEEVAGTCCEPTTTPIPCPCSAVGKEVGNSAENWRLRRKDEGGEGVIRFGFISYILL